MCCAHLCTEKNYKKKTVRIYVQRKLKFYSDFPKDTKNINHLWKCQQS